MTDEVEPAVLHQLWRKPWYPFAKALLELGTDVTVLDPEAETDEDWSDGDCVIQVRRHNALGWQIIVSETDTEEDE